VSFLRSTLLRVNSSHKLVVPLNSFPLIVISLSVSTSTVESPILNEMTAPVVGKVWQYLRTSYWAEILPTERPCISLDKIIIIIIVVVVDVIDFSDNEPRLRRILYRQSGGYGDRFRLRHNFEMSR